MTTFTWFWKDNVARPQCLTTLNAIARMSNLNNIVKNAAFSVDFNIFTTPIKLMGKWTIEWIKKFGFPDNKVFFTKYRHWGNCRFYVIFKANYS